MAPKTLQPAQGALLSSVADSQAVEAAPSKASESRPLAWEADYHAACDKAKRDGKVLLIYFTAEPQTVLETSASEKSSRETAAAEPVDAPAKSVRQVAFSREHSASPTASALHGVRSHERLNAIAVSAAALSRRFEKEILESGELAEHFIDYVSVKLPITSALFAEDRFKEMGKRPGLVLVDYRDADASHYGEVVSVFPFLKGKMYNIMQVRTMLTLPAGTLPQRSLIYAVRVHPERPASANSTHSTILARETTGHCEYMARICVQGHQNFDGRFRRVVSQLPGHEVSEVCAESWPGENVLEAALDCVHCWRQSSGHWRGVSGRNSYFAYDMRKGRNGIWYATGLFAK